MESQIHFSALVSCGRCEYLSKGRCAPCHQHPFPYFLSYTHRKEEQASMMLFSPFLSGVPNGSNTLVLIPLLSDQTGKKASHYSGSICTLSASYLASSTFCRQLNS